MWLSSLVHSDERRGPSRDWLATILAREIEIAEPAPFLVEIAGAVARQTGLSDLGATVIERLLDLDLMKFHPVDQPTAVRAAEIAADLKIADPDALYLELADRLNVALVSWESELGIRAGEFVDVWTPEEYERRTT